MTREQEVNNQVIEFFKTHEFISVTAVEKSLKLPDSTIRQAMVGNRNIPLKHLFSIIRAIIPYGFKLNGFSWELDDLEYIPNIYGSKDIEEMETIEENNSFFYVVKQVRTLACDITDLL